LGQFVDLHMRPLPLCCCCAGGGGVTTWHRAIFWFCLLDRGDGLDCAACRAFGVLLAVTKSTACLKCPSGRYGSAFGLSTHLCTDQCPGGYQCPPGSVDGTQIVCGAPPSRLPLAAVRVHCLRVWVPACEPSVPPAHPVRRRATWADRRLLLMLGCALSVNPSLLERRGLQLLTHVRRAALPWWQVEKMTCTARRAPTRRFPSASATTRRATRLTRALGRSCVHWGRSAPSGRSSRVPPESTSPCAAPPHRSVLVAVPALVPAPMLAPVLAPVLAVLCSLLYLLQCARRASAEDVAATVTGSAAVSDCRRLRARGTACPATCARPTPPSARLLPWRAAT
jgi:hypothetical protein